MVDVLQTAPPAATALSDGMALPAGLSDSAAAEFMGTRLNAPIPLAYGRHLVAGAPIFQYLDEETKKTTLFIALGEGEWDSIEVLWVNGLDVTNTANYHFHPGTDGETGTEEEGAGVQSQTRTAASAASEIGPDGDTYPWLYPEQAKTADGHFATCTVPSPPGGVKSHWLALRDFGFSIPSDATIRGILAVVWRYQTGGTSAAYSAVKLLGVTGDPTKGDVYGVGWPRIYSQSKSYGSSTDLWGSGALTPAVINDPDFGAALCAWCTGPPGNGAACDVDVITLTVYYEEAGAGSRNQQVCSLFPTQNTPLTFSRTAYLSLLLDPDPGAPDAGFDVRGIYRTKRVRTFDSSGNQLTYAFSQNPAWQILDLIIDHWLKPRALVNEALAAGEKAKIDFPSFASAATYADELITVNGVQVPRFQSNVIFVDGTDLNAALTALLAQCRGYLLQEDGKFKLLIDAPRASVFTLDSSNVAEGSLSITKRSTREMTNRLVLKARDPGSGEGDHTKDFKPWQKNLDDETQQDFIGRVIPQDADFGAQTPERCERMGKYILDRTLKLDDRAALRAILDAGKLSPGDRVVGPAEQDFSTTRDYEVIEVGDNPDGTRDLQLQKYDESVFSDTAEVQQAAEETNIPSQNQPLGDGQVLVVDSTQPSGVSAVPPSEIAPDGTGFRHITTGVEDDEAKLVEDADVAADAGISQSKIAGLASALATLASHDMPAAGGSGQVLAKASAADYDTEWVEAGAGDNPLVVGFIIGNGAAGTDVGPMLPAPRGGQFTGCKVTVKGSDPYVALRFLIRQNGANVFDAVQQIAPGTLSPPLITYTNLTSSPLTVSEGDIFTLDIEQGSDLWQFVAVLC